MTITSAPLIASAKSPEDVRALCVAAIAVEEPRDRLVAITSILSTYPDPAQRKKFVEYLAKRFR